MVRVEDQVRAAVPSEDEDAALRTFQSPAERREVAGTIDQELGAISKSVAPAGTLFNENTRRNHGAHRVRDRFLALHSRRVRPFFRRRWPLNDCPWSEVPSVEPPRSCAVTSATCAHGRGDPPMTQDQ